MTEPREYSIGYKKPPHHSQYQPGQSGNPRGRPKKAFVGIEIVAELNRRVTVRENGVEQKMSKAAALAKSLVARALAGDMRAIAHLIRLLPAQFQAPPDTESGSLEADDAAVLKRFLERRLAASRTATNSNSVSQDLNSAKEDKNV